MKRNSLTRAELEFARTLAPHVLWARKCNNDEPSSHLTREEALAVALVLENDKYILACCFSPKVMAFDYVCKGRVYRNRDSMEWLRLVRDAIERFNSEAKAGGAEDPSHVLGSP